MTRQCPDQILRRGLAAVVGTSLALPWLAPPLQAAPNGPAGSRAVESPFVDPAPARAAVPQDDAYIIGPGDGLSLRFLSLSTAQELSGPVEVISDGTATVPLLGSVRLTGLTLSQASLWLQSLYSRELLRPELDLSLVRPRPLRVALVGQVQRPGAYTLSTAELSETLAAVPITGLPTLVDAIQKAGGVTGEADLRQVVLRRRLPGEEVRYRRARVNLLALIQEGDLVQNPILFDGDIIQLPKAEEPVVELTELAVTTIAPSEITVNVVGEVERPGPVTLRPNTPLVQAVLAAGGTRTWRANNGRIELVRINRNGTLTRQAVPLNLGAPPSPQLNPPMQDGDTVVVFRSNYARFSDALQAIGGPITSVASILAIYQLATD